MRPSLPEKYYLQHARELFGFVEQECQHLLSERHKQFLAGFAQLSEDAQCLLVRCWARKPDFIKLESLAYAEISSVENAVKELKQADYVADVDSHNWPKLVHELIKPQLILSLQAAPIKIKNATPKASLLEYVQRHVSGNEGHLEPILKSYLRRQQRDTFEFILFLFFGDLRNRFQKFAMRDLGVMKTRKSAKTIPRFESAIEAQSAYTLQKKRRELAELENLTSTLESSTRAAENIARDVLSYIAIGASAQKTKDKLLLNLGSKLVAHDSRQAIALWRASTAPGALEKWVREVYRSGDREALKLELEHLRQSELASVNKVFIEDFYARKYQGKRTSIFTDMLRESARTIELDEAFVDDVEYGVINAYQHAGATAFFTENAFWRSLFGLVFWEDLFGATQTQYSEFDHLPSVLRNDNFYQTHKHNIESSLAKLSDRQTAIQALTYTSVSHYGKPNGLFRWSPDLLNTIVPALEYSPPDALSQVLRRMTQNYRHCRDGYPDLMVINTDEDGDKHLRFEEVKAPGDVLRPNQLVSINRLRNAGFYVDVSQVHWATNPNQTYAVVDIETTGARKGANAITEIAVVKVRNREVVSEWSTLVNPRRHIPRHITQLTGIDNAMVADAPVFTDIADELSEQLENCIFVAHNVGFDYGFIKAAYQAIDRPFRKPKICTVRKARKAFPGLRSYSLGALTAHFDIDLLEHHRALSDARATADLLRLIQEQIGSIQ